MADIPKEKIRIKYVCCRSSSKKQLYVNGKLIFDRTPLIGEDDILRLLNLLGIIDLEEVNSIH